MTTAAVKGFLRYSSNELSSYSICSHRESALLYLNFQRIERTKTGMR